MKINKHAIEAGLNTAKLPARFEIMQEQPFIILDGAHNPDKFYYLTKQLKQFKKEYPINKTYLISALTTNKNISQCFIKIIQEADYLYCVRSLNTERAFVKPKKLAEELTKLKKIPKQTFLNPHFALRDVLERVDKNDLIIITGSFFLCGDLRNHWIDPLKQLELRTNFPK